jgi:hypothetical protein
MPRGVAMVHSLQSGFAPTQGGSMSQRTLDSIARPIPAWLRAIGAIALAAIGAAAAYAVAIGATNFARIGV